MPEIRIAREAGACYGVERALQMVRRAAEKTTSVKTLGPLIHNPQVVRELGEQGVSSIKAASDAQGGVVVLRTHGVTPEEAGVARAQADRVIDATCPYVKNVHKAVELLEGEGYQIVVVGEQGHPEVVATVAHAQSATVIKTAAEARSLTLVGKRKETRVGIVVQTTMAANVLGECVAALAPRVHELRVINTICEATSGHQSACADLAREAHVMIVVGGKNSANTTHLAEIARELCPLTYHIESLDELEGSWFDGADLIGITAGASTPAYQIEAVVARIKEMTHEA